MKIENQVCTLEQAKKLKELGIYQGGIAQWYYMKDMGQTTIFYTVQPVNENSCSAFTVAELGIMLPLEVLNCQQGKHPNKGQYFAGVGIEYKYGNTEAEARAAMLIYLLENNLTTPEEVNKRLIKS